MNTRILQCVVLLISACTAGAHAQAWKPTRPVEIVVGVTPGGGIDRTARLIQKIIVEKHLVDVPVTVVNKPGAGMTLAMLYINQHPGDAHYLFVGATSELTNQIMGKAVTGHRDLTAIAMLYDEYIGFGVKGDSPYRNARDLLEAVRARPESLPIAIATSLGNTNHIAAGMAVKQAGGDLKRLRVVTFGSGGESMTSVMGGHTGIVVTPSANLVNPMQTGRLIAIGVAAPNRLPGPLARVPTLREQGFNTVVTNWRPLQGPKGLTPAQVAFWEEVMAKVTRSDEWKADVEAVGGVNHFMNNHELTAYFESQYAEFHAILGELGLAR